MAQPSPSGKTSSSLADDWRQGVLELDQAAKNLQKTNILLSCENARMGAAIQSLEQQMRDLSTKALALAAQRDQLKVSLDSYQDKAMFFLDEAGSLDKKNNILEQEEKDLVALVQKEKDLNQSLQASTARIKTEIEALEKSFFLQQQRERQLSTSVSQGQAKVEACLHAQETALQRLGRDLRAANQGVLFCYLTQGDLNADHQRMNDDIEKAREDLFVLEKQRDELLGQNGSEDVKDTLISAQDPSMVEPATLSLRELLTLKKRELSAMRKAPISPTIISLKADIENLRESNRSLQEELSRLHLFLKRLDRQRISIQKTLTQ